VKISLMGASHKRIHHQVTWNNAAVKILHEKYRKKTPCISMGVTNDSVFFVKDFYCSVVPGDLMVNAFMAG
ncbi:hypothetical protein ACUOFC_68320, partial [Escherichia sp. TWPC-MK]